MIENFVRASSAFQRPHNLVALLEGHRQKWTLHDLFNNPKLKPFKETWQAAVFGLGYEELTEQPVEVRICEPEPFPDFQVRIAGLIHDFESRLVTTRRLGTVYRGDKRVGPVRPTKPATLPPFDPEPIREAVRGKASKNYSGTVNLLLYASFPGGNAGFDDVARAVNESGGEKFESVWVITYDHVSCPRPSGRLAQCNGWLRLPLEGPLLELEQ